VNEKISITKKQDHHPSLIDHDGRLCSPSIAPPPEQAAAPLTGETGEFRVWGCRHHQCGSRSLYREIFLVEGAGVCCHCFAVLVLPSVQSLRPHLLHRLPLTPPSVKGFGRWERRMQDKVSNWHCSAHLSLFTRCAYQILIIF
jgi:hypothetical protein